LDDSLRSEIFLNKVWEILFTGRGSQM
jgi:hypothetical protein